MNIPGVVVGLSETTLLVDPFSECMILLCCCCCGLTCSESAVLVLSVGAGLDETESKELICDSEGASSALPK
jgi:hypothetical protein